MKQIRILAGALTMLFVAGTAFAQEWERKFEQLGTDLPTGNSYRTASGAPGSNYWQQKADYVIDVEIDDATQMLIIRGIVNINISIFVPYGDNPIIWIEEQGNYRCCRFLFADKTGQELRMYLTVDPVHVGNGNHSQQEPRCP